MPQPKSSPPVRSPGFDKLTTQIVNNWLAASSITARHELGLLLGRLLALPHGTSRAGVLEYVAGQITKKHPAHPARANYLQRIHRFGAEWTQTEARQFERSGIPWRYVVKLLPYRHQGIQAHKSEWNVPANIHKLDRDLQRLTRSLQPGNGSPANARSVQAWLRAHQNRLPRRSNLKVGVRELAHARRAMQALEGFLGRALPVASTPISLKDQAQALASVRTLKQILRRLP